MLTSEICNLSSEISGYKSPKSLKRRPNHYNGVARPYETHSDSGLLLPPGRVRRALTAEMKFQSSYVYLSNLAKRRRWAEAIHRAKYAGGLKGQWGIVAFYKR